MRAASRDGAMGQPTNAHGGSSTMCTWPKPHPGRRAAGEISPTECTDHAFVDQGSLRGLETPLTPFSARPIFTRMLPPLFLVARGPQVPAPMPQIPLSRSKTDSNVNEDFFAEGSSRFCQKTTPEPYEIATSAGSLEIRGVEMKHSPGDYIMTRGPGDKYPLSPSRFFDSREDHGDGTASPNKALVQAKLAPFSGDLKTSWGERLQCRAGEDYIVRRGRGDYTVMEAKVFTDMYTQVTQPAPHPCPQGSPRPLRAPSSHLAPVNRARHHSV